MSAEGIASLAPAPTILSREDVRRLETALRELGECRKLIDTALEARA